MGRPKGSPTKRVKIADVAYQLTIGNDLYLDALQVRLLWGAVPARVETHLWDHIYGQPPKSTEVSDDDRKPLIIAMRKPLDYDPLAGKLAERKAKAGQKTVIIDANAPSLAARAPEDDELPRPGEGQGSSDGMETVDLP